MSHRAPATASFFLGALLCAANVGAIAIDRFDVSILLEPDGAFTVTETIEVDFGDLQKHGIFRTLPVSYSRAQAVFGIAVPIRYALRLRVLGVEDGSGAPLPFRSWPEDANVFIRIGDPERTVTGRNAYVIRYRVQRAINRFESHDELYWNVTGNEWDWPIRKTSVRVELPFDAPPGALRHQTFTGPLGARSTIAKENVGSRSYEAAAGGLRPGEGLTFVLGFPKGSLAPPSATRELFWKLGDNVAFLLVGLAPVLALAAMLFLYLAYGRDPGRKTPIVVQYQPPEDLSPAEAGALLDERLDTADIISTVIDLAVRGYLSIHEEESKSFLFLTNRDYRFEKRKPADEALRDHERAFFSALFARGDSVPLSSLKNRFYVSLPSIRKAIVQQMLRKHLFPRDPEQVRRFYRGVSTAAALAPVMVGIPLLSSPRVRHYLPPEPFAFVLAAGAAALLTAMIVRVFARAMPVKTAHGAKLARHCLGFQEFVTRVEKDRLERMVKDDPRLFERVLPYAIVLGVADEWADRFAGLLAEPPSWYHSPSFHAGRFDSRVLVSDLGRGMHSMGSTLTSAPAPSSGSGGISFGGGGSSGFSGGGSGGGFGGGGGGSW